jgi:RNA polymerase sigma factor (sigma-70 family)
MANEWRMSFTRLTAALRRRGSTDVEAEDIAQEAWLRLDAYRRVRTVEAPEAFLMRTALNLAIDAHRVAQRRGETVALEEAVLVDCSPSAEEVLLARERVARLSACLLRLTPRTRGIFLAHRLEGKTYAQIAQEYGITVSGVERHIAKAIRQVTSGMEGC